MAEDAVAYVSVIPVAKGAGKSIADQVDSENPGGRIGDSVSSGFLSKVGGIGLGLVKAVTTAVAVSGGLLAGLALKGGLDRVLNIQDAQAKLKGLGHDTETVTKVMDSALASVKGTAFGLDAAATIAASAISAGIKPGEELTRYLSLTADSATIAGTSLAEMGGIWGKVATSGKLTGDVVNQFQERGIPILQLVADQYGITADAAGEMVSRGEVDFATFQNAIETGMGGAALASGATARGAFANVQAALSRIGALFVGPAVAGAPALFTSIANATDRAGTALKPYADTFSAWLIPAMAELGTRIDTIDFGKILGGIQGLYDLVVSGDFTTKFREAFNLEEDSGFVTFVLNARTAIGDLFEAIKSGDFSNLGESFGNVSAVAQPLFPLFVQLAKGIGGISGSIGEVISAGLPLLVPILNGFAQALTFLGDNPAILAAALVTLAGAFAIQRTAATAALSLVPLQIAADIARTAALVANTRASQANTASEVSNAAAGKLGLLTRLPATASILASIPALIASTAAMVAQKAAQVAGAAAMGIAAAAQWALNAAMNANPIAIIVIAIAALVAGLIWFFTQTELGQEIWANFTKFLGEAWANIVAVATTVFTALGQFFSTIWNIIVLVVTTYINLVFLVITTVINAIVAAWNATWEFVGQVITNVWNFIVTAVTAYINLVLDVVTAVVNFISDVWTNVWNGISSFFTTIWTVIVAIATSYIQMVLTIISTVVNTVSSVWNSAWSGISSFFGGIWSTIISTVSTVGTVFGSVFNTLGDIVTSAFNGVVSVVKGVINGIIDAVNGVIGGINGVAGAIGGAIGVNLSIGKIPRLAAGGVVSARPGGIIANIGEGRYDEAVVPLSPKILDTLAGGTPDSGGTTWNIHEAVNALQTALAIRQLEYAEVI